MPTRLPTIGLMGQPGSGKSTVAGVLSRRGWFVLDADAFAREVFEAPALQDQMRQRWRLPEGPIDRGAAAGRVFHDPAERRWLESRIHPAVAERRAASREAALKREPPPVGFVEDCPLLLETGLDRTCDTLWLVWADEPTRLERVRSRGWGPEELRRRDAAQLPLGRKREAADVVLENHAGPEALLKAVDAALRCGGFEAVV